MALTGIATSLSFILIQRILTTDPMFDVWEFDIAVISPALSGLTVTMVSKSNTTSMVVIAYLTLLAPILGSTTGSSDSEPLWQFAVPGLAGGLIWSIPLVLGSLIRFCR